MADATLTASIRTERGSGPAGRLRRDGQVPAVVYGLGTDTIAVAVSARELDHILHSDTGANSLITLKVDGADVLALARQIQRHPTRNILEHVDFIRVSRDTAVAAEVPLVIVGEAPGTKAGGKLEQQLFTVSVSALPDKIPTAIEVSIAGLALGDQIKVGDKLPSATFRVHLTNGHDVLATMAGKMRRFRIRVLQGDRVSVEVSPYDLSRGRITYRYK